MELVKRRKAKAKMPNRNPQKRIVAMKEIRNLDAIDEEWEYLKNLAEDIMSSSIEKRSHAKMRIRGIDATARKSNLHQWMLIVFTNAENNGVRKKLLYVLSAVVSLITLSLAVIQRFEIEGNYLNLLCLVATIGLVIGGEYVERRVDKLC